MRRYEIRYQILFFTQFSVDSVKLFLKSQIYVKRRFVHILECVVADVLGRNLELSADVMFDKLAQEFVVFVVHYVIESYTRAHENFLYSLELPQSLEKVEIFAVVYLHCGTRAVAYARLIPAYSLAYLLCASGISEVCRRTAHVVNIALEIFVNDKDFSFFDDIFFTALLYYSALMKSYRAIVARAETASDGSQRILDLFYRGHALFIYRVIRPLVGQCVYFVHLLDGERILHRILH